MEAEKMLQADLLDLIFDNRNKSYGAYVLRKEYNTRLYWSMGMVFLIMALLYLLIPAGSSMKIKTEDVLHEISTTQVTMEPPKEQLPAHQPKQPAAKQTSSNPKNPVASTSILIVDSSLVSKSKLPANDSTSYIKPGVGTGTPTGPGSSKPGTDSAGVKPKVGGNNPGGNTVTETADVMPSFPGGMQALHRFLEMNLNNPSEMEPGERITVKVKFVVGYDGQLKNFEILQDGGTQFNNEVIRVIKKMPNWIPGKSNGTNVSVYHVIPVIFVGEEQ